MKSLSTMKRIQQILFVIFANATVFFGSWAMSAYIVDKFGELQTSKLTNIGDLDFIVVPGILSM